MTMPWEEVIKLEQLLKDALSFYEGLPDGQYDEVAASCIKYALAMKPWNADREMFKVAVSVKQSP